MSASKHLDEAYGELWLGLKVLGKGHDCRVVLVPGKAFVLDDECDEVAVASDLQALLWQRIHPRIKGDASGNVRVVLGSGETR
jgi:hypothetical protein